MVTPRGAGGTKAPADAPPTGGGAKALVIAVLGVGGNEGPVVDKASGYLQPRNGSGCLLGQRFLK